MKFKPPTTPSVALSLLVERLHLVQIAYSFLLICSVGSVAYADQQSEILIARVKPAVVSIDVSRGGLFASLEQKSTQGSGFYISPNHVLTAWHVVQSAKKVTVTNWEGRSVPAGIVEAWPESDLALIEVEGLGSGIFLKLSDQLPREGEKAMSMGYPFGFNLFSSEGMVSSAVAKPKGESIELFATDAVVNPGMSGGPLVGQNGQVLGILSRIYSSTGSFAGITFAYPSERIKLLLGEAGIPGVGSRLQKSSSLGFESRQ